MSARKYIVFDRPVQQGLADLCGASVNVHGCGDIEELHFADGKEFDALHIQVAEDMANRAMVDTYRALSLPAKKRTAAQRQLLARAKHLDAEARDRLRCKRYRQRLRLTRASCAPGFRFFATIKGLTHRQGAPTRSIVRILKQQRGVGFRGVGRPAP